MSGGFTVDQNKQVTGDSSKDEGFNSRTLFHKGTNFKIKEDLVLSSLQKKKGFITCTLSYFLFSLTPSLLPPTRSRCQTHTKKIVESSWKRRQRQ